MDIGMPVILCVRSNLIILLTKQIPIVTIEGNPKKGTCKIKQE